MCRRARLDQASETGLLPASSSHAPGRERVASGAAAAVRTAGEFDAASPLVTVVRAAPRRPGSQRGPAGRLVPPRAVMGQSAGLARLRVGGDGEHRQVCPVPAALGDVGMRQGAADRGRRPFRADRADLGDQRVQPWRGILVFVILPLPLPGAGHRCGRQRPWGRGEGGGSV